MEDSNSNGNKSDSGLLLTISNYILWGSIGLFFAGVFLLLIGSEWRENGVIVASLGGPFLGISVPGFIIGSWLYGITGYIE